MIQNFYYIIIQNRKIYNTKGFVKKHPRLFVNYIFLYYFREDFGYRLLKFKFESIHF